MKKLNALLTIVFILIFLSCTSATMTSDSLDDKSKLFVPEPNKANIYFVRSETYGAMTVFRVVIDGKIIGALASSTYLLNSIDPGEHTVAAFSAENSQMIQFSAEAGSNYFFDVSKNFGWNQARVSIEKVSEEEGREQVIKSERAVSMSY